MSDEEGGPIETAPKGEPDQYGHMEGPVLLLWLPDDGLWWPARWVKDGHDGSWRTMYSEVMGSWSVEIDNRPEYAPTHWMYPLPPPKDTP